MTDPMTAKLSAEERERLEALAQKAEPIASGLWDVEEGDGSHTVIIRPSAFSTAFVAKTYSRKIAAYIAAANPSVLLKLTAQVREAEARWEAFKEAASNYRLSPTCSRNWAFDNMARLEKERTA